MIHPQLRRFYDANSGKETDVLIEIAGDEGMVSYNRDTVIDVMSTLPIKNAQRCGSRYIKCTANLENAAVIASVANVSCLWHDAPIRAL